MLCGVAGGLALTWVCCSAGSFRRFVRTLGSGLRRVRLDAWAAGFRGVLGEERFPWRSFELARRLSAIALKSERVAVPGLGGDS